MSTRDFPKRLAEKLRQIREHFGLTPDEFAPRVGARTGAEITAYENDEGEMPVSVLWKYTKVAGCSLDNLIDDNLEVGFRELKLLPTSGGQDGHAK